MRKLNSMKTIVILNVLIKNKRSSFTVEKRNLVNSLRQLEITDVKILDLC